MPFLLEHITEAVIVMMLAIIAASGVLIAVTMARRKGRERYFRQVDDLRQRFSPLVARLLEGRGDYERDLAALDGIVGPDRVHALELLLLARKPQPAQVRVLRRLCEDLDLVKVWQDDLCEWSNGDQNGNSQPHVNKLSRFGYLARSAAAEKLGLIRHQPSWPLLAGALNDPHPDVCAVAARSLAALGEPGSFPALVDQLHAAVLHPTSRVSLRTLKMALVSFPIDLAPRLLPSLRHPDARIRFVAVDILREMNERAAAENFARSESAIPPEIAPWLVERLCRDESANVRARCAPLLAALESPAARSALFALLDDAEWFVRLHAVRALARQRFADQAGLIAQRLTDSQWMVREAAARTLLALGRVGLEQVYAHLLATRDRYSKEQIADDLQRAGLVPAIVTQYGKNGEAREARVLEEFAALGKTSCILAALKGSSDRNLHRKFLAHFGKHPDPQIRAWVKAAAAGESAPEPRQSEAA